MTFYKIKPLNWERRGDDEFANSIFGSIRVEADGNGGFAWSYCVDEYYDEGQESCESIEDGKAKALDWYMKRLEPALVRA